VCWPSAITPHAIHSGPDTRPYVVLKDDPSKAIPKPSIGRFARLRRNGLLADAVHCAGQALSPFLPPIRARHSQPMSFRGAAQESFDDRPQSIEIPATRS
jgi:hypothetical protein